MGYERQEVKEKMLKEQNDEILRQKGVKEKVIPFYQIWQVSIIW